MPATNLAQRKKSTRSLMSLRMSGTILVYLMKPTRFPVSQRCMPQYWFILKSFRSIKSLHMSTTILAHMMKPSRALVSLQMSAAILANMMKPSSALVSLCMSDTIQAFICDRPPCFCYRSKKNPSLAAIFVHSRMSTL